MWLAVALCEPCGHLGDEVPAETHTGWDNVPVCLFHTTRSWGERRLSTVRTAPDGAVGLMMPPSGDGVLNTTVLPRLGVPIFIEVGGARYRLTGSVKGRPDQWTVVRD